jgi:hypothetical protein
MTAYPDSPEAFGAADPAPTVSALNGLLGVPSIMSFKYIE